MPEIMGPLEPDLILKDASITEIELGLVKLLAGKLRVPPEQECIEYVLKNYSWRRASERLLQVYTSVCTSSRET
jgi:hypothetical protein